MSSFTDFIGGVFKHAITPLTLILACGNTWAEDGRPLVTGPDLQLPSVWRVTMSLLLVALIAMGLVIALRKLKSWLPSSVLPEGADVTVVARRRLTRTLTLHIVDVHKQHFMIIESAHGVIVTSLKKAQDEATL